MGTSNSVLTHGASAARDDESEHDVTAIIPVETLRECAAYHRARLAEAGLVQDGAK